MQKLGQTVEESNTCKRLRTYSIFFLKETMLNKFVAYDKESNPEIK